MTTCFGTYESVGACESCHLAKQCQAYMVSDGLDEASSSIELLLEDLPDQEYPPVQTMSRLVALLLDPEKAKVEESDTTKSDKQFAQPRTRTVSVDDLSFDDL